MCKGENESWNSFSPLETKNIKRQKCVHWLADTRMHGVVPGRYDLSVNKMNLKSGSKAVWVQLSLSADLRRETLDLLNQNDWTRKRRKGIGKRRCQASPKNSSWQHPRYHQTSYSSSCPSRWSETYLWTHLRGDPWCSQGFPWECHSWCSDLHRARQKEDRHRYGCRLRFEEARTYPLRIRWIRSS